MRTWNVTFEQYLTEQLQSALGCTFKVIPLPTPDAAYTLVANNQTDFLLVNSGLTHCVQVGTLGLPMTFLSLNCALTLGNLCLHSSDNKLCVFPPHFLLYYAAEH